MIPPDVRPLEPSPEEVAKLQAAEDAKLMELLQMKLQSLAITKPNRAVRRSAQRARRKKEATIIPKAKRRKRSRKTGNQAARR